MSNYTFKRSNITEMCKQIVSAPVIFRLNNGTECLAFYNNEDFIKATKLYIMFPDTSFPKYIEGNDLYNLRESILHNVTKETAEALYCKINKSHKDSTINLIQSLINKAPATEFVEPLLQEIPPLHTVYNKKHACAWVKYEDQDVVAFVKDLKDKQALEIVLGTEILYNVTFECVYWAAGISAREFTDLKVKLRQ